MKQALLTTIGSDPEIALVKDSHVIPSGVLIEKSKDIYPVIDREYDEQGQVKKGYKMRISQEAIVYEDGMSVEFNLTPSTDIPVLVERFRLLLSCTNELARNNGYQLEIKPMIPVTQEDIDLGGVVCARFGCDPDETIYNDAFDPARVDARNHMARYFGCHIHSGMTRKMIKNGGMDWVLYNTGTIITAYDLLVGTANVIVGADDLTILRRKVYGRAGRHRVQMPYGWEYRTPDNYVMRSPELLGAFFHLSRIATFLSDDAELVETLLNIAGGRENLFETIVESDQHRASNIFNTVIEHQSVKSLFNELTFDDYGKNALNMIVPNIGMNTDFMEAWGLNA